jgi:hypothetical protein
MAATAIGIGALLLSAVALAPQAQTSPASPAAAPPRAQTQAQEEVATQRLVLTDESGAASIVLAAGPESSLLVLTPSGSVLLRLGGQPARRIGH